jgi:hypothetical protein
MFLGRKEVREEASVLANVGVGVCVYSGTALGGIFPQV